MRGGADGRDVKNGDWEGNEVRTDLAVLIKEYDPGNRSKGAGNREGVPFLRTARGNRLLCLHSRLLVFFVFKS